MGVTRSSVVWIRFVRVFPVEEKKLTPEYIRISSPPTSKALCLPRHPSHRKDLAR
jgi:hypothetical protein